jgi:hypothetical protein
MRLKYHFAGYSPTMAKRKRKLTAEQRRAKKKQRKETMIIFINGKQKRVRRPPTIDGMDFDEFIRRNADPIWLHQNEMWELITPEPALFTDEEASPAEDFDLKSGNAELERLANFGTSRALSECNPYRVGGNWEQNPRVARSSQPWAE